MSMGWTRVEKIVPLLIFVLGASFMPGCGGNGGETPTENPPCLRFEADSSPTSGEVTARRASASTCDQLILEIVVTDIDDVWAMGSRVTYPHSLLTYRSMDTSDTFLDDDGVGLQLEDGVDNQVDNGNGTTTATFGVTRVGQDEPNISATGERILATLVFRRVGTGGSGQLALTDPVVEEAVPGGGTIPKDPQPPWSGGAVSVNR
jgi:hypothetical protein